MWVKFAVVASVAACFAIAALLRVSPTGEAAPPATVASASAGAELPSFVTPARAPAPPAALPAASPAAALAAPSSEASLMADLRRAAASNPALAIDLAREGNHLYPSGADAPERASILIHGLVTEGKPSEARGEAENMVNRYPDSDWVREVERFTGAHRHRNLRLGEDGGLESY